MNRKSIASLVLCLALLLLAACAGSAPGEEPTGIGSGAPEAPQVVSPTDDGPAASAATAKYTDDGRRIITIGTWYDRYYVSKHQTITDDPELTFPETAQMRLDRTREIEEKYNIVLDYVNMTFDGVQESIHTSIAAGSPDVDIYEVDSQFGIPAVLDGCAVSLEEMGLQGTDVFGEQVAVKYLNLMGQQESYLFAPSSSGALTSYVLAFNLDMLEAAGLENPQDLYDRQEWTWDRWREYLAALTQPGDSEDDGPEIYGFSGYWTHLLRNLLFSNGAGIASGPTQTLDSQATVEVLEFIHTIYNVDRTARPWDDSNWDINNELYAAGLSGFWVGSDWLFGEQGGGDLPFAIGVVPWPCGPSGDSETNKMSQPQTNWYFIPRGTEDPRLVYDVIYDWINWYDGDLSVGVDMEWAKSMYMTERNYDYAAMMDLRPGFDLWESLGVNFALAPMLKGEQTPAQVVDEYAPLYQEALNRFFQ